jgi:transcriptional regulator with XRE-family HTH domain
MRYKHLLQKEMETEGIALRELARKLKIPPPSLHNYLHQDTAPRRDALEKMAIYFREPISLLLSDEDDLTARILTLVHRMNQDQKQAILNHIENHLGHIWAKSPSDK